VPDSDASLIGMAGAGHSAAFPELLTRRWSAGAVWIRPATVPTAAGLAACLRDGRWRELRRSAGRRSLELVNPGRERPDVGERGDVPAPPG
jgi:hypothetical protein